MKRFYYYPFGLAMAGISSKAAGGIVNHKKFVAQVFDEDLGVDLYQFKWRNHDPQIGRFLEIDPLANEYEYNSTYAYAENRPIDGIDLEGLEFFRSVSNAPSGVWYNVLKPAMDWINANLNPVTSAVELISGKDYNNGNFDIPKPRMESAVQLGTFLVPTAKVESVVAKEVSNVIVNQVVKNAENSLSRKGALNEIKRDLSIPKSQHPDKLPTGKQFEKIPMTDRNGKTVLGSNGKPVMTREYTYTKPDGSKVKVQDHSAGHPQFSNNPGSHFNVRPPENTRNGKVEGTKKHYPFF